LAAVISLTLTGFVIIPNAKCSDSSPLETGSHCQPVKQAAASSCADKCACSAAPTTDQQQDLPAPAPAQTKAPDFKSLTAWSGIAAVCSPVVPGRGALHRETEILSAQSRPLFILNRVWLL
jgi:hypothetical protein